MLELQTLGGFARSRRLALDMSIEQVAELCGLDKSAISRIESGETEHPRRSNVTALARALRTDESKMLHLAGYRVDEPITTTPEEQLDALLVSLGYEDTQRKSLRETIISLAPAHAYPLAGDEVGIDIGREQIAV